MNKHTPETDFVVMDYDAIIIKATPNPTRFDRVRAWVFEKVIQLRVDDFFIVGLLLIGTMIQQDRETPVFAWIHEQSHMSAYTWTTFMLGAAGLAWTLRRWYWVSATVAFIPIMALVVFHIQYILVTPAPDYVVALYIGMLFAYITIAICGPYILHLLNMLAAYDIRMRELESENSALKSGGTNANADTNTAGV